MAVTNQNPLDVKGAAALLRTVWDSKIEYAYVKADPMIPALNGSLSGTVKYGDLNERKMIEAIPEKIMLKISDSGDSKFARTVRLQKTMPLSGDGVSGRTGTEGTEEQVGFRYANIYANDVAHASSSQEWGIDAREAVPTKYASIIQRLLGTWRGEKEGLEMRYALLNRYDSNLSVAPISLTSYLNPNCLAAGLDAGDQPAYDSTGATHNSNIYTALNTAGNASTVYALSISNLLTLSTILEDRYIKPFVHEGKEMWALYVHRNELKKLKDPAVAGTWGAYIKDVGSYGPNDISKIIPGASFLIDDKILLVEDPRCPTMGLTAAPVATQYFMKMGRNDERPSTYSQDRAFYANLLVGENALVRHNPEAWHYEFEKSGNYGKVKGVTYAAGCSFQIPTYDLDTPTDSSILSEGSAVIFSAAKVWAAS